MKKAFIPIFLLILMVGCAQNDERSREKGQELMVSAAISLTAPLEEVKQRFEKETDITINYNFGGSGSLAQQIEQGAPVDVFISANEQWMDALVEKKLVNENTVGNLISNKLVLIAGLKDDYPFATFETIDPNAFDQLAIGNPESVPAGQYAAQLFSKLQLEEALKEKLVLAKDVRQVLTYVETGNADLGVVYQSDAYTSDKVTIIAEAPENLANQIVYPVAMTGETASAEAAEAFIHFLQTEEVKQLFLTYGFEPL